MKAYLQQSIAVVVIGLVSLLIYSSSLERPPHNDELYHMLAAQGLLATGEPAIGEDGRYWRGYPMTWIVAQSLHLFGDSLAAGRLPSVIFMTALVVLLFVFLYREAGALAAWLGAGLFAVSPFAIDMAQFVRFYSLQGLTFFAAAWLVYHLVDQRSWRNASPWLIAASALALFGFAAHLQVTTMLGIVGLGAWVAGALLLTWLAAAERPVQHKRMVVAGLVAVGLAILAVMAVTGSMAGLWAEFRFAPLFSQPNVDRFWFYHAWYVLFYPTLWTLIGLLTVLALIDRTKPAIFAMAIFGIGVVLNSLAGPKSLRYIFYAQPFLFVLWGIGLAAVIKRVRRADLPGELQRRLVDRLSLLNRRAATIVARILMLGALVFIVLANSAWLRSVTLLAGITVPPELPPTLWQAARPALQPWLTEAEVVVVAEELNPLYFYGRADILLNASRYAEIPADRRYPFAPDHRTDVPSIADAASLERVIDCYSTGLFVIEKEFWGPDARTLRDPEVEDLLVSRAERLPLPPATRLLAFTWTTAADTVSAADCRGLPVLDR